MYIILKLLNLIKSENKMAVSKTDFFYNFKSSRRGKKNMKIIIYGVSTLKKKKK